MTCRDANRNKEEEAEEGEEEWERRTKEKGDRAKVGNLNWADKDKADRTNQKKENVCVCLLADGWWLIWGKLIRTQKDVDSDEDDADDGQKSKW